MDIAALGYEIDSSQAVNAAKDLKSMALASIDAERAARDLKSRVDQLGAARFFTGNELSRASQGLQNFQRASNSVTVGSNNFANSLTNVSFQVQDFAVQVASGQSALMAFAQQFPQLTGALGFAGKAGLYGAVIGTAAAIGVSLYQAFGSAGEKAKSLDDTVGDMDESFSNLSTYLKISAEDTAVLSEKFGMFAGQIRGFNEYMAGIAIAESLERSGAVIDSLRVSLDAVATAFANVQSAQAALDSAEGGGIATPNQIELVRELLAGYQSDLDEAASSIGLSANEALRLRDALNQVKAGRTMQEQAVAAAEALKYIQSIYPNAQQLPAALRPTYTELSNIASKAAEANENIKDMRNLFTLATSAASSLSGAVAGIAGAAQRAGNSIATMAQRLWDAAQAKATFNGVDAGGLAAQYNLYGQGRRGFEENINFAQNSYAQFFGNNGQPKPPSGNGGGGGGGGGAAQKAENELERLQIALQKDSQFQIEKYERDYEVLKNSLEKGLLTKTQYKELEAALNQSYWGSEFEKQQLQREMEQQALEDALEKKYITQEQYNQRIMELQNQEREITLGHYDALFGNMATIAKAGGDKATAAVKAFSIAQGLINSYLAYTQVLADPSLIGRPFLRTALAASTLAAGLAQVAHMGGGGGGAGRAGGTTSATSATASEPNRVTRVELVGDDWLVKLAESMMTQIYDASRDGRVIVARG